MDDRQPAFEWPLARGETLSGHDWVPFHRHKFLSSSFVLHALAEGRREDVGTAVLLWAACYDQDPGGALPDDDVVLAHLAGFGTDVAAWRAVRGRVLRGWQVVAVREAEEGQVFIGHPFIAGLAADMHKRKRGRDAARSAAHDAVRRSRVRKKLLEMGRARAAENSHVVAQLAEWLGAHDLYVTSDNLAAGLAAVNFVEIGRKGPRGPEGEV